MSSELTRPSAWRISAPDLVFLAVLGFGMTVGRSGFYNDPGTFWHLRLGREILQTGSVPRADFLTYTRDQTPWVDQSWLFDTGLAWVVNHWGWSGASALSTLIFAATYSALCRWLIRDGATPLIAGCATMLVVAIGSIHFLIRPHLFTYIFVFWTLRACRDYHLREDWRIWTIPAVVALGEPAWGFSRRSADVGGSRAGRGGLGVVGRGSQGARWGFSA